MTQTEGWPWVALAATLIATYLWRGLGVAMSGRLDPHGRGFELVMYVAYALLAALIARLIVIPVGPMVETSLAARVAAAAVAVLVFYATGRGVFPGVVAGAIAVVLFSGGIL